MMKLSLNLFLMNIKNEKKKKKKKEIIFIITLVSDENIFHIRYLFFKTKF